jgi:integrase
MPRRAPQLSQAAVKALNGPGSKTCVSAGLYLYISKGGAKDWVYRYAVGQHKFDMGLGSCATVTLAEARDKVIDLNRMRVSGIDPRQAKRAKLNHALRAITFGHAVERFYRSRLPVWSASNANGWLNEMRRQVLPVLGKMLVDQIETADIVRCLTPFWTTRYATASRNRGRIENVLQACIQLKERNDPNPAQLKLMSETLAPAKAIAKIKRHHAAMPYEELPAFLAEVRKLTGCDAVALELMILTVARTGEILGMRHSEIDLVGATWTVPAERMKSRKEHVVPLVPRAVDLLTRLRIDATSDRVFETLHKESMIDLVKRLGGAFTGHGMRASFSTYNGESTNTPRDIVERCLAHATGNAAEQAYRQGKELVKRRKCLTGWADYLAEPKEAKVVPIRDKRRA